MINEKLITNQFNKFTLIYNVYALKKVFQSNKCWAWNLFVQNSHVACDVAGSNALAWHFALFIRHVLSLAYAHRFTCTLVCYCANPLHVHYPSQHFSFPLSILVRFFSFLKNFIPDFSKNISIWNMLHLN